MIRILFQGDSITDGGYIKNGDKNHDMGQCYPYLVAARMGYEYPDKGYEFINRGLSGNSCIQLCGRWQEDALDLKPDVISILVGVNDVFREANRLPELCYHGMGQALELLLSQTRSILPLTKLILMEPFILDCGNIDGTLLNRIMELLREYQKLVHMEADRYGALFVPLQERFNKAARMHSASYWLWDSVHPTYAGHGLIADAFICDTKKLFDEL